MSDWDAFPEVTPSPAPKGGSGWDAFPEAGAAPTRSTGMDIAAEAGKGLARGAESFAGDIGEAVMGPFGPQHHLANLLSDFGIGERKAPEAP